MAAVYNRNFGAENDDRLSVREKYAGNVDRVCMERQFAVNPKNGHVFKNNDRDDDYVTDNNSDNDNDNDEYTGEITGSRIKSLDKTGVGMPMRSQYNIKKSIHNPNEYLDFDIHNITTKKPKNTSVQYNDSTAGYANIEESTVRLSAQIEPVYIVAKSIEKFNDKLFAEIAPSPNSSIVNTLGLYTLFASLYVASSDITERELKKIFDFPDKSTLHSTLITLTKSVADLVVPNSGSGGASMINIKNFMIVGDNVPYDSSLNKLLEKLCVIARVDIRNAAEEAAKLCYIINKMMGTSMRNPITSSQIDNLQLMFMSFAVIHPVWSVPFDNIVTGKFNMNDMDSRNERYLISSAKAFAYYDDNDRQVIEIGCGSSSGSSSDMVMGIILHKIIDGERDETEKKIHKYITHMRNTVLEEVIVPMFTQDLKVRYNGVLKKIGVNSIFYRVSADDLFPGGCTMHDVLQNVRVVVDNSAVSGKKAGPSAGQRSILKFIANRQFMYYFRLVQHNAIIMSGMYR